MNSTSEAASSNYNPRAVFSSWDWFKGFGSRLVLLQMADATRRHCQVIREHTVFLMSTSVGSRHLLEEI
jgi:hypothetical protein